MDELYLETQVGLMQIDPKIVEKYNLKKGMLSPFTNSRIVDKNGDFTSEREQQPQKKEPMDTIGDSIGNDEFLSTAEAIDIATGADSYY